MIPSFSIGIERPEYLWLLLLFVPFVAIGFWSKRKIASWRRIAALGARLALLLLITLALAGVTWDEAVDDVAVVFVLDRSASVSPEAQKKADEFVKAALAHQEKDDVAGVVVFGADALVDQTPREDLAFSGTESKPSPHQSDLAAGIRLAAGILPSDRARRVVVLSDGEETRGDAATQVMMTAGQDLEVAVVPLSGARGSEVLLEDLIVPSRVDEGAAFDVRVVARSDEPAKGKLRIYRNDQYLGEMAVELEGGRAQVFSIRQEADSPGLYRYRAVLEVEGDKDAQAQNNEVVGTTQVTGKPRVLYAEGYPEHAEHLASVLREQGLVVDIVEPSNIPSGPSGLRPYAAVILSDVPAYALTTRQQEGLHAYVRDMGRGLVMVGGDQSFGLGGYYDTPVEAALPVNMDLEDKSRFPKLAMIHAIDKSCSMGEGAGSPLGLAKEAAIRTIELLNSRDQLGVIGFDSGASWIVPLQPLVDKPSVTSTVASIRGGGGTDIYPALEKANGAMNGSDAALKHVIVMSDGITAPGDFQGLLTRAHSQGITTSAIAIGSGADRATMQSLATWGGGSYYLVTDATAIPAIFTREALLASRSFLVEEDFVGVAKEPSDLTKGLGDLPVSHGYIATEAKPRAVVALQVPGEHPAPLLAHWHYGLGRSVAFTSDCKPRWSKDWIGSDDYTRLWAQTVRWAVGDPNAGALQVESEIRDGELTVTVDAFSSEGDFRNFLDGEARVIAPDLTTQTLELRQVAPGRYRASIPVDQDGSWLVGVAMKDGEDVVGQAVAEAVQPYSPEYRVGGVGPALLAELGTVGGGGVLTDPAAAFARPTVPQRLPHPIWPLLVAIAAFLLLMDVALRRVEIGRGAGGQALVLVRPAAAASRPLPKPASAPYAPAMPMPPIPDQPAPEPEVDTTPAVEAPKAKEVDPESYAGKLLAARGKARKKMGGDS
jgi:uncharacterized membrane protein